MSSSSLDSKSRQLRNRRLQVVNYAKIIYYYTAIYEYYKEYHAELQDDTVTFPLHCCDPLPLHEAGILRVFRSSSMLPASSAQYFLIQNPDIDKVVAVRGRGLYSRSEIYIGYSSKTAKRSTKGFVYQGEVLFIQTKDTEDTSVNQKTFNITYLDPRSYHVHASAALGLKPITDYNAPPADPQLQEACYSFNKFCSSLVDCYWSCERNHLKGFSYQSRS